MPTIPFIHWSTVFFLISVLIGTMKFPQGWQRVLSLIKWTFFLRNTCTYLGKDTIIINKIHFKYFFILFFLNKANNRSLTSLKLIYSLFTPFLPKTISQIKEHTRLLWDQFQCRHYRNLNADWKFSRSQKPSESFSSEAQPLFKPKKILEGFLKSCLRGKENVKMTEKRAWFSKKTGCILGLTFKISFDFKNKL